MQSEIDSIIEAIDNRKDLETLITLSKKVKKYSKAIRRMKKDGIPVTQETITLLNEQVAALAEACTSFSSLGMNETDEGIIAYTQHLTSTTKK